MDNAGNLIGIVTKTNLLEHWLTALATGTSASEPLGIGPIIAYDLIEPKTITAVSNESCRDAAERMARTGVQRLPVVDPGDPKRLVGIVTIGDLLKSHLRVVEEEGTRERFLGVRAESDGIQSP